MSYVTYRRALLAYVEELGGADARIEQCTHGGHPQLRFSLDGADYSIGVSSTPSDQDAALLKRRDVRRMLGIRAVHRVGARRVTHGRRRRAAPPFRWHWHRCALPDWRDALRRHPLYRAAGAAPLGEVFAAKLVGAVQP